MALNQLGGSHWSTSETPSMPSVDKENISDETSTSNKNNTGGGAPNKALSPTWIFNAAMLSNPVDLSALVAMSRDSPLLILNEVGLLNKMVEKVLNAPITNKRVDKDTRLDVLNVLGNLSKGADEFAKEKIKKVLQGVSSWFESYVSLMEDSVSCVNGNRPEPELYKAMLLLLARIFDYNLRTEDLLELTSGNRQVALESVVGILEDGEMEITEVAQLAAPKEGQRGAWQQRVVTVRHEKPLILQMCSLLLGFTRADTYFSALDDGFYFMEAGLELPEYCIEKFSEEIDALLNITMKSGLVEKLSNAVNAEMFQETKVLDSIDHLAVVAIHSFLQNLYLFACDDTDEFRHYILCDTLFVPQLVIPYLDRCIYHAAVMTRRCTANQVALGEFTNYDANTDVKALVDEVSGLSLDYPELVSGMESTLRTLVICSFRAPRTRLMYQLLLRYNPTASLLRMKSFIARHDYLFFLLLVLNINCGSFDISNQAGKHNDKDEDDDDDDEEEDGKEGEEGYYEYDDEDTPYMALVLLQEVLSVYEMQSKEQRMRVLRRVEMSGALPVARDTSSYLSLLGVLTGSYVNSYQENMNPSFLLTNGGHEGDEDDEDDEDHDDSLCLDGIGPSEEDELNLDLALLELEQGYPGYGDSHSALGGGSSDVDAMSETLHFNNSRQEAKQAANQRMENREADEAMEKLCITGDDDGEESSENNPFALYEALSERCASTFTKTGKELMGDEFCMELNDMENDMNFLDSLVAADLAQCKEELKALETEVRMLQNGEDLDGSFTEESDYSTDISATDFNEISANNQTSSAKTPINININARNQSVVAQVPPVSSMLMGSFSNNKSIHQSKQQDDDDDDVKSSSETRRQLNQDGKTQVKAEEKTSSPSLSKKEGFKTSSNNVQVPSLNLSVEPELQAEEKEVENKTSRKTSRKEEKRKNGPPLTSRATARGKRSLLGDLPSLDRKASQQDIDNFLAIQLKIPTNSQTSTKLQQKELKENKLKENKLKELEIKSKQIQEGVPKEFTCAINGHVMRDPYKAPNGHIYEKATILLWLETRGNICPITHVELKAEDLKSDSELKTKIMRYHISKSMKRQSTVQQKSSTATESVEKKDNKQTSEDTPLSNLAALGGTNLEDDMYDF